MAPDEKSPLASLQDRVYRAGETSGVSVDEYRHYAQPAAHGWEPAPVVVAKKHWAWTTWFLIVAAIFFVVSAAGAAYLFYSGHNAISNDRIKVTFTPESPIASGDTVPIVITVENKNPTEIFDTNIFVDLPQGTRNGTDPTQLQEQYSEPLGVLGSGEETTRTIPVQLFGAEGDIITIPVRIEYRIPDSNALLVARREFTIPVSSSPISITVSGSAQSASGQPVTVTALVRSNATTDLRDVAVIVAYPPGFIPTSSEPQTTSGVIALGDLAAGSQRQIRVTGTLTGEVGEVKVFRFTVGNKNPDGTSTLAAAFAEGSAEVRVIRPTLAVALSTLQDSGDTIIAAPGETISMSVTWENAAQTPIENARIEISLSGAALDDTGIVGGSGFYRSSDRTIVFSRDSIAALGSVAAGDKGVGSFTIRTKNAAALVGVNQPTITLTVKVSGTQNNATTELAPTFTRTVRVATTVSVSSSAQVAQGPATATAGVESTYAVNLMARNTLTSVGGAKVTTRLPEYVQFNGALGGAAVTYDQSSRTVTWNVGDLTPSANASAGFSVKFTPSTSQSTSAVALVREPIFTGTDRFTGAIRVSGSPILVDVQ